MPRAVDIRDFMEIIDLRRKDNIRSFEFRLLTKLEADDSVVIKEASSSLSIGAGLADLCAIKCYSTPIHWISDPAHH